jgi:hypothetical protein
VYEADVVGGGEGRGAVLAGDVRNERSLARRVTGGGVSTFCGLLRNATLREINPRLMAVRKLGSALVMAAVRCNRNREQRWSNATVYMIDAVVMPLAA